VNAIEEKQLPTFQIAIGAGVKIKKGVKRAITQRYLIIDL
jgi:hypothetical protein